MLQQKVRVLPTIFLLFLEKADLWVFHFQVSVEDVEKLCIVGGNLIGIHENLEDVSETPRALPSTSFAYFW